VKSRANPGWEFLRREWDKHRQVLEGLEDAVSKLREDCGYFVVNEGLLKLWSRRYDLRGSTGRGQGVSV
jgi:hypothetical protein